MNEVDANQEAEAKPRTLSHIVYFVPDMDVMANFYIERLGFVVTDKFKNTGPFLRPQANNDHHVLFMLQTPEYMQGLEHLLDQTGARHTARYITSHRAPTCLPQHHISPHTSFPAPSTLRVREYLQSKDLPARFSPGYRHHLHLHPHHLHPGLRRPHHLNQSTYSWQTGK